MSDNSIIDKIYEQMIFSTKITGYPPEAIYVNTDTWVQLHQQLTTVFYSVPDNSKPASLFGIPLYHDRSMTASFRLVDSKKTLFSRPK